MPGFVARMLEDVAKHPERTDWHQYSRGFGHPRLVSFCFFFFNWLDIPSFWVFFFDVFLAIFFFFFQTNALAKLYSSTLGVNVDAEHNVLVTVGAYLSLYYSFMGWLNDGDEVIGLYFSSFCKEYAVLIQY